MPFFYLSKWSMKSAGKEIPSDNGDQFTFAKTSGTITRGKGKKILKKHFGTSDTSPLIVCKVTNCCVCLGVFFFILPSEILFTLSQNIDRDA